jgi:hypothetical protein
VLLHLRRYTLRQRLPRPTPILRLLILIAFGAAARFEAGDEGEPVGEGGLSVDRVVAHALVEARDDVDEGAHDVGEEGHTRQHYNAAQYHLVLSAWQEISIARCC